MEPSSYTEKLKPHVSEALSLMLLVPNDNPIKLTTELQNMLIENYISLINFPSDYTKLQTELDEKFPLIASKRKFKYLHAEAKSKATSSGFRFKGQDSVILSLKFSTYDELQKQLFPQRSLSYFYLRDSKSPKLIYSVNATYIWNVFSSFLEDCLLIASIPPHLVFQPSQPQFAKNGKNEECKIEALQHVPPGVYENSVENFYTNLHGSNFNFSLLSTDESKFFINHLFFPDFRQHSGTEAKAIKITETDDKLQTYRNFHENLFSDSSKGHFRYQCFQFFENINNKNDFKIICHIEKVYKKYLVPQFGKSKYATGYFRQSKLKTDICVEVNQYPFLLIENKVKKIPPEQLNEEWLNLFNSAKVLLLSRLNEQSVDPKKRSSQKSGQTSTNIQDLMPFMYVGLWKMKYTNTLILTLEIKKVSLLNIDNNQLEPLARDNFPVCSYQDVCTFDSSKSSDLTKHFGQIERFILQDPLYRYLEAIQSPLYTLGIRKYEPPPLVIILAANRDSKNIKGKNPRPAEKPKSHLPTLFHLDLTGLESTNLPKPFSKYLPSVRLSKKQSSLPFHSQSVRSFDKNHRYYYYVSPGYFLVANFQFYNLKSKADIKSIMKLNLSEQIPAFPFFYHPSFPNCSSIGILHLGIAHENIPILLTRFFGEEITGNPRIGRENSKKLFLSCGEAQKRQFIKQFAFQLYHLHKNKIFHNDIHPNNVLIVQLDNSNGICPEFLESECGLAMLLIDFDLLTFPNDNTSSSNRIESPYKGAYQYTPAHFVPSKGKDCFSAVLTLLYFLAKDLKIFRNYSEGFSFYKKYFKKFQLCFKKYVKSPSSDSIFSDFLNNPCNLESFQDYLNLFTDIYINFDGKIEAISLNSSEVSLISSEEFFSYNFDS